MKGLLQQPSTWRGLLLLGSSAAAFLGYGHLFSADIAENGVRFGGVVGAAVPVAIGIYDTLRDEFGGR